MPKISFCIYERSYLIRKGLISVINKIPNSQVILQTDNLDELFEMLNKPDPDFIIVNSTYLKPDELKQLAKQRSENIQLIALLNGSPKDIHEIEWAETISIYDSQDIVIKKINKLIGTSETHKSKIGVPEEISRREVDILKYIALGYLNKEIADKLFISTHTVVTHRKNITRKLGIKTVSGLTIYAIINKIIDINDTE